MTLQLVYGSDPGQGGPYFPYDGPLPEVGDYIKHRTHGGRVTKRVFMFADGPDHSTALLYIQLQVTP